MNHERLLLSLFACVWADLEVHRNTKAILRVGRGLLYDIEWVRTCSAPVSVLRKSGSSSREKISAAQRDKQLHALHAAAPSFSRLTICDGQQGGSKLHKVMDR